MHHVRDLYMLLLSIIVRNYQIRCARNLFFDKNTNLTRKYVGEKLHPD